MNSDELIILAAAKKKVMEELKEQGEVIFKRGTIYGFHVDSQNSNPSNAIMYLKDAVGMTPAYMDFSADEWNWGSWWDAFFLPRPCMLKYDGTVDYYLDEDNYEKKEDGSQSDIADLSYEGNAMMEWGRDGKRIYYKLVNDKNGKGYSCYIADYQADNDYKCYSFINNQGDLVDHFYTPIYDGSLDDAGRLRSMSGAAAPLNGFNAQKEINAALLNNTGNDTLWYTENVADSLLINILLVLITKSLDSQGKVGIGNAYGGSEANNSFIAPGSMNDKGMFWGKNVSGASTTANHFGVKAFGMENWWGNTWRRMAGMMIDKTAAVYYKLTWGKQDGSDIEGYPVSSPTGMIEAGLLPENLRTLANGFASKMCVVNKAFLVPTEASGASTKYYCDQIASNPYGNIYALRGGSSGSGGSAGAFALGLNLSAASTFWTLGASVSCKPLAR